MKPHSNAPRATYLCTTTILWLHVCSMILSSFVMSDEHNFQKQAQELIAIITDITAELIQCLIHIM